MKQFQTWLISGFMLASALVTMAEEPLRVYIRSGPKTHGPGQHDYPQFLKDWTALLNERGAVATGGNTFPTKEQLDQTDVLILHAEEAGNINIGEERKNLLEYQKRGGGLVVIHGGAVSRDPDWYKQVIGGSWKHGKTKWLEGHMSLYFTDRENPITKDFSNFDLDDEIYYDMELLPEVNVLAAAYTPKADGARNEAARQKAEISTEGGKRVSIYDIQPQIWTYEKNGSRAFVSIPGHQYENFSHTSIRTLLLRGIAWAAKRDNVDMLCKPEEIGDALRYPAGGPTRPELAAQKLEVHPEFEISLVAAEPLINKPLNMEWDEKGRLWVVESPEYPNGLRQVEKEVWKDTGSIKPGQYQREPLDRIAILRDTDGDGVMDTKHIFADKLELATSFVFHRNGVIVSAAPDIWYLEDTDGDARADKRTKLYTGLGTFDTHAVMNNMRWGADGWIYATHGYSAGEVVALGKGASKEPVRIASGVVRFKPNGSTIEMFSSKNGNTWGLEVAWDGNVFWTQPTSGTVFYHTVLPEYILGKARLPGVNGWNGMISGQSTFPLMKWEQQAYVQIDLVGQFTAAAGCAVYEGGAWPEKWNYSYFTGEPTINIVHHQLVKPQWPSYTTHKEAGREETEFIRSRDLWFRPVETKIGPDGALYLIDFYNQAVIHNDTRGPQHGPANAAVRPDRDHYFGRIWKIQHKQAKKIEVPVLDRDKLNEVVDVFRTHPNVQVRNTAWRVLTEEFGKDHELVYGNLTFGSGAPYFTVKTDKKPATKDKPYLSFVREGTQGGEFGSVVVSETKVNQEQPDETLVKNIINELAQPKLLAPMTYYRFRGALDHKAVRAGMLDHFARAEDDWTRNVILAVATDAAVSFIDDALHQTKYESNKFAPLVSILVEKAIANGKAAEVIKACTGVGEHGRELVTLVVAGVAKGQGEIPAMDEELQKALRILLENRSTAVEVLPLAVKWDKKGVLAKVTNKQRQQIAASLRESYYTDAERLAAVTSLIQVGRSEDIELAARMLGKEDVSEKLQRDVIKVLGDNGYSKQMVEALVVLPDALRGAAFDEILKRPEATMALLDAVEQEKVLSEDIGPGNVARLRTHPDRNVAARAVKLMDKLNPMAKAKDEIIAKLFPEVMKSGDVANGKVMFTAACAVCHKYGDVGVRDVGPPLTGMGAHGAAELLTHIVDPNREVDPSFWQWNLTNKKGETFAGVIVSENANTIMLRHQGGDVEIRKEDIATRENTHRSLMPEGLDALGANVLRDILAFMTAGDQKFRVIDLREAYTADSRRGLFAKAEAKDDSVFPVRYGNVEAHGIPFFVMDPQRSTNGLNLVVLKGGGDGHVAREYPQKVEIPVHVEAKRLHLLSGIAGWGWPAIKDQRGAMKVTLEHANGEKEVIELLNGVAFADYIKEVDVPGSRLVEGFVKRGQVRLVSLEVRKAGPIQKLILESYDNHVTPVVFAITADVDGKAGNVQNQEKQKESQPQEPEIGPKEGGKGDRPMAPVKPVTWEEGKTKVLVISGGSSHDFSKFFGTTDVETLKSAGFSVHYTEDRDQAAEALAGADVAVISVNRMFFDTPSYRKAVMAFAEAGKGIVMMHPGTWYAYPRWPELNAKIVGGGSRGHDKLGEFAVNVVKKDHPVMEGVPDSFKVVDELYYVNAENVPEGTVGIEVLAETSPSQKYSKPHPSVWLSKHPKAKVVNIALGHDERVHELEAFKSILKNAVKYVSGK